MATTRKDLRGRILRKGEMQRSSDKRYAYSYTDPLGRRKYIYANDLVTLREKEAQLTKDQMDGLNIYVAGKATVNFVFDRYMSLKTNLRQTTRSNYLYMYDRFIRDTFGKKKIAEIRYSDVLRFYNYLLDKQGLQTNTLESVHTLLHPTFQLAVRDEIVRKNPTDGVMAEIKKSSEQTTGVRHALTIPQQRAFMEHIANHPVYCPTSPRKMRLVADIIRGVEINKALGILRYSKKEASIRMEKLLKSAIANWEAKNESERLEDTKLCVKEVFVDGGRMLKRIQAAPQGRAHRIRKRSNHVTIVVDKMVTVENK